MNPTIVGHILLGATAAAMVAVVYPANTSTSTITITTTTMTTAWDL
jgi:hypothetical protein